MAAEANLVAVARLIGQEHDAATRQPGEPAF